MLYHYTYEYGWVDGDQAQHIYHSRDGQIGLSIRTERIDGIWNEGVTRFFLIDREGPEFESMALARAALKACGAAQPM